MNYLNENIDAKLMSEQTLKKNVGQTYLSLPPVKSVKNYCQRQNLLWAFTYHTCTNNKTKIMYFIFRHNCKIIDSYYIFIYL